ncbi:unnamed protein product, partial [marine sediment metagenome]
LHAITRGLPVYAEYRDSLLEIISGIDFIQALRDDLAEKAIIINIASFQLYLYGSEIDRVKFSKKIIDLVRYLFDPSNGVATELRLHIFRTLLDPVMNVSVSLGSSDISIKIFCETMSEILDSCPELASELLPAIDRLWSGLPTKYAQHIAPLVVKIRALV